MSKVESFRRGKRFEDRVPHERGALLPCLHRLIPLITHVWAVGHYEEFQSLFGGYVRAARARKEQTRDELAGDLGLELTPSLSQDINPWYPAKTAQAYAQGFRLSPGKAHPVPAGCRVIRCINFS